MKSTPLGRQCRDLLKNHGRSVDVPRLVANDLQSQANLKAAA